MLCTVKSHALRKQFFQISLKNSQLFGNEFITTCYHQRGTFGGRVVVGRFTQEFVAECGYIRLFFQSSSENSHFTIKKVLIFLHHNQNSLFLIGFCRCQTHGW